jgi:uncharacterized surface protein with fasciclin (FAS1) repeats
MDRRKFLTATAALATAPLALSMPAIARTGSSNIVELAAATPELSTLVTAVQAAGLVDTLSAPATSPSSRPPTRPSTPCPTARSTRF